MRALALLMIAGCVDQENPPVIPRSCSTSEFFGVAPHARLDLLFVIDDSPAMMPYLTALESNAPAFMNVLTSIPTRPDLRIAVAHASNGAMVDPAPCGVQAGALWIEDSDRGTIRNYTGDLATIFTCMVHVGTDSTSPTQPLASTVQAISSNRDFLRDKAYLFVVVISPQDDASPNPARSYFDALNAFKYTPNHLIGAAITRLPSGRLQEFVEAFGNLGTMTSIDQASWVDVFAIFAVNYAGFIVPICIGADVIQPLVCTFTRVVNIGTPTQMEVGTMSICSRDGQPTGMCAGVVQDPACQSASGSRFVFCYNGFDPTNPALPCLYGTSDPFDGETVVVECATRCD